jgi:hypothetical protein
MQVIFQQVYNSDKKVIFKDSVTCNVTCELVLFQTHPGYVCD